MGPTTSSSSSALAGALGWSICVVLGACGASQASDGVEAATTNRDDSTGAAEQPQRIASSESVQTEAPGQGEVPTAGAAGPRQRVQHEGSSAGSAEELRADLEAASHDAARFLALVDPAFGVAAYDTGEDHVAHFCDVSRMATEPGLGFTLRQDDEFSCDPGLTRCSIKDDDGAGYVVHLRRQGGALFLDTVARYDRRVPRYDAEEVTEFIAHGAGVCALYRALSSGSIETEHMAVFESGAVEGVEETAFDYLCDEQVAERISEANAVLGTGPPHLCNRNPASCSYFEAHETRFLGRDGEPIGVAYLGVGLSSTLRRLEASAYDTFLTRATRHRCP